MSDYGIKNLKELDNSAEEFGLAPDLEARFGRKALGGENAGISYQKLAPDFEAPFGHSHRAQEEIYVIVSGSGRIKLGDEVHELKQWDAVRVAPSTVRAFASGPDGLELIAFGAGEAGDTEMVEKPWS